jgi:predicted ATPase/DNA-binding SARP family transcriptional activator
MAYLSLSLFGALKVVLGETSITSFESDKVRALLVYLVVEADRPHRREALAGLLWPDQSERAARHNLSQALFNLRQAIGDATATPAFLLITRTTVQFNLTSDYWSDTAVFSALLASCDHHRHRELHTCTACTHRLAEAVDVYRGDFLAQFSLSDSNGFEEWALLKRERLQHLALQAFTNLATYHERRGAYEQAQHFTLRQIELDPWREAAHRQLMRTLTLTGQRNAALAHYERCRQILAAELSVEPEAATKMLYERIRNAEGDLLAAEELFALPSSRPHNLPPQLTPFIGRERELAELADLLGNSDCRLITIVGPGGIGKTRLALQAATEQLEAFADGIFFLSLAALRSTESLIFAIREALKLTLHGSEAPKTQILNHLREKEMLLVLDNFEHLVAGAPMIADMLKYAPDVTILATSRERLNLQGEMLFHVGGMLFPKAESAARFEQYSAVELFVQSARRVQPDFAFAAEEQGYVARICQLLEGMPLGIELAAAWVRALSCAEIAQELEQGLEFLTTSLRDVPERHRSLRAVFDHSWDLLCPAEQRVFGQLAVFRGGFRREAAEQVADATLPMLAALIDKSLLRKNIAGRYAMHELVRQYAWEKLHQAGELEATHDRLLLFFLQLAEAAEPQLIGPGQKRWLDRLEDEHDNLRAALQWALEHGAVMAGRLAGALWRFWWMHSHLDEGRRWLEQVLSQNSLSPVVRAKVLHGAGVLMHEQGKYVQARARYEESLALRRQQDDRQAIASSLNSLGVVALDLGDYRRAQALYEESLELKREQGDRRGIAGTLGMVMSALGNSARGRAYYEESLQLSRKLDSQLGIAIALGNLGWVALEQQDAIRAQALFAESLALFHELGDKDGIAECLEGLAGVADALCGAAESLRAAISSPRIPIEHSRYEAITAAARGQLGATEFTAAWAEGQVKSLEQAIAYALDIVLDSHSPTTTT